MNHTEDVTLWPAWAKLQEQTMESPGKRPMKVIIAGSRDIPHLTVKAALEACPFADRISEVVCGCCHGADRWGWDLARKRGIPVRYFPAWDIQYEWAQESASENEEIVYPDGGYGRGNGNGILRNLAMGEYAEGLIAVPSDESRGTANMIGIAERMELEIFVWRVKNSADQ